MTQDCQVGDFVDSEHFLVEYLAGLEKVRTELRWRRFSRKIAPSAVFGNA